MKLINTIKSIWDWLDGKKSYITAVVIAVIALLDASGITIPDGVYVLLTAVLGASIRSAIPRK